MRNRSIGEKEQTSSRYGGSPSLQIAAATFGILSLELAMIRWTSGQVRVFAYFNNLVLIASFLGMGLGLVLGRRHGGLLHWTLPTLAAITLVLGFAEPLGLVHIAFPDTSIHLWGAEFSIEGIGQLVVNYVIFLCLIVAIVVLFLFAGSAVGSLFPRLPALKAYRWDLVGSLLGVVGVTIVTAMGYGPWAWLALAVVPFAWLSRRPSSLVAGVAVLFVAAYSAGGAYFSPYNRIDLRFEPDSIGLDVNRDFHQSMHDLSDEGIVASARPEDVRGMHRVYDLPFVINNRRATALIVGAGTGNDVAEAIRQGYGRIHSVDIDPEIIELGRQLHPERPYEDRHVKVVVDDARAFFENHQGEVFDAVVFGLLDSHSMFTSLSSLRLDNFVYTEEGIRAAWQHVAPEGHLSVSFSIFGGAWIFDRLYWTIAKATGREPIAFLHGMHYGCTFIVAGPQANLDLSGVEFPQVAPTTDRSLVKTTSDDWPFLYVRPGVFPWGYILVLCFLLIFAVCATVLAFGKSGLRKDFDPVLFLMGEAFLLIETRGVTALSLLFGSTWVVNSAVFAGIFVMALLANEVVIRFRPSRPLVWFPWLLASVLLVWAVFPSTLSGLPIMERGAVGGLLNALPVGFAGIIVSILLARSRNPAASLGSNLLGSVFGGCLEYLSMITGLRALALVALFIYVVALLALTQGAIGKSFPVAEGSDTHTHAG
ncbi:MAG: hypothetical protein HZA17_12400 [Nitrospirae bacterium]|nr:hypothetical protein [Nitrospirota bacterium]